MVVSDFELWDSIFCQLSKPVDAGKKLMTDVISAG